MNDNPIVGVLAAATRDHLLIDVQLHITLCDRSPKGKVLCERDARKSLASVLNVFNTWERSTRKCKWCVKKREKRQAEVV